MNLRRSSFLWLLAAMVASLGFTSCSTLRKPHPTVGMLFLEKGGNAIPRGAQAYVILRAVDGEMASDQIIREGRRLQPGLRTVTLSSRRDAGSTIGGLIGGEMGYAMGRAVDELGSTQFDERLTFRVEAGHDYLAKMSQSPYGYVYWIEDTTTKQVVADSRSMMNR